VIRANVVSPGTIITPAYKLAMSDEQFEAQAAATAPLGRVGTPDEIAKVVLFLASGESSYVTASNCSSTVARHRVRDRSSQF
jgi:NAD(P)-dependent dehydrogenase (short-subunit alcohol dehydrogenase family)